MVIGPATYQQWRNAIYQQMATLLQYRLPAGAFWRAAVKLPWYRPPLDSTTKIQHGITFGVGGVNRAFAPVWSGIQLIKDPYTDAASGEVSITAHLMWDFVISQAALIPHGVQVSFKTAA